MCCLFDDSLKQAQWDVVPSELHGHRDNSKNLEATSRRKHSCCVEVKQQTQKD